MEWTIGPYQILKSLGKGGMGEVFLAYDPRCRRNIALKRIRPDLEEDPNLRAHFLYEAHLTGLMSHPSIIPIFEIVDEPGLTYYTMPYIQGITLSELISLGREKEKEGRVQDSRATLPALLYSFLDICYAVSYAHSKGVIHRDLKPSNFMICSKGEAVILDWGLGRFMKNEAENVESKPLPKETPEKVTGTIAYISPEQALGQQADYRTDIYALGLILYEILTFRSPFHRENIDQYRHHLCSEVLLDPAKVAPRRAISPVLSLIVLKCLSSDPKNRYCSIDELLADLENYLKTHAHWFQAARFDNGCLFEWEMPAENSLVSKLRTSARSGNPASSLWISKRPFGEFVKVSLRVKIGADTPGIGFLIGIPPAETFPHHQRGYCLWLSSEGIKTTRLFCLPGREIPIESLFLACGKWHEVQIEKMDHTLNFYIDQKLQFTFVQHLPLRHSHIGFWLPDDEAEINDCRISIGGCSFDPNPLDVANAFLAGHHFEEALDEYRSIARRQPLTLEGRKALFRAGVTLLENYRWNGDPIKLGACLQEFQKLSDPLSVPLALLGQLLVHQYQNLYEAELECFEMAFTRYKHHSFIHLWYNQLLSRLLEHSELPRPVFFRFLLLALRHLPEDLFTPQLRFLLDSLKEMSEPLDFLNDQRAINWPAPLWRVSKSIRLAFWLASADVLAELIDEQLKSSEQHLHSIANALCALLELGAYDLLEQKLEAIYEVMLDVQAMVNFDWIYEGILISRRKTANLSQSLLSILPHILGKQSMRIVLYILNEALRRNQTTLLYESLDLIEKKFTIPDEFKQKLTCCRIWAVLLDKNWLLAEELLSQKFECESCYFSVSPAFLKGCLLAAVQGKEAALQYLSKLFNEDPSQISDLFLSAIQKEGVLSPICLSGIFIWRKRQLFRELALFYHCLGENKIVQKFKNLEKQEYLK